jgi:lipopolysaccharide/colanic/teichoic acid biosynthesis glycosyltransferase
MTHLQQPTNTVRVEPHYGDPRVAPVDSSASLHATAKRLYDVIFSVGGLVFLSPLFLLIAALIKISDGGKILYRQTRVGLNGRPFRICKFRTMIPAAEQAGPAVTKDGDARITWIGRILRKTKLDEFPQLWNVLKGEMSLVGPRPEVPRYVECYTPEQREILRYKPGITDLASLRFREEEALLEHTNNVEEFYIQHCMPRKLKLNQEYSARANLLSDSWIILQTLCPYWVGVLVTYAFLLAASYGLSRGLIHNFTLPPGSRFELWCELALLVAVQLGCLMWRRQHAGLLSYFSFPELRQVVTAVGVATLGLFVASVLGAGVPARNVILLDAILSVFLLSGFRVLLRFCRERSAGDGDAPGDPPARVGIIGASSTGAKLALELVGKKKSGRIAVAFFDDDFQKWQKCIHEVPIVGMPECLLEGWAERLDEVVITMPGPSPYRVREIELLLHKAGLRYYTVAWPPIRETRPDGVSH